jgi:ankyrin repeat protein
LESLNSSNVNDLIYELPPLELAVRIGDADLVLQLLNQGADINGTNPRTGNSALAVSIMLGKNDISNLILRQEGLNKKYDAPSIKSNASYNNRGGDGKNLINLNTPPPHTLIPTPRCPFTLISI